MQKLSQLHAALKRPRESTLPSLSQIPQAESPSAATRRRSAPAQGSLQQPLPNQDLLPIAPLASEQQQWPQLYNADDWEVGLSMLGNSAAAAEAAQPQTHSGTGTPTPLRGELRSLVSTVTSAPILYAYRNSSRCNHWGQQCIHAALFLAEW